jgi:hypothetical protein
MGVVFEGRDTNGLKTQLLFCLNGYFAVRCELYPKAVEKQLINRGCIASRLGGVISKVVIKLALVAVATVLVKSNLD